MAYSAAEFGTANNHVITLDPSGQPLGGARFVVPSPALFAGRASGPSRQYYGAFDEALLHSRENAERMRLDPVIDLCLNLLVQPISLLTRHVTPHDPEDPVQVTAAATAEKILAGLPGWTYNVRWILDNGVFIGRSALMMRWEWKYYGRRNFAVPTGFRPVHGDKLVFWHDDSVGLRVNTIEFPFPTQPTEWGPAYKLNSTDRKCLLVFNYQPEDSTYYRPLKAGTIHGTGIRDKLYWFWALKNQVWGMSMDWLRWFARGLTVYYFPGGNPEHATEVEKWIKGQSGQDAMMLPWIPTSGYNYKPVERFEASTASPQFIQSLITQYFDDIFKQVIVGQTLTSGTASTGLGSGVSAAHQSTFETRVKYVASGLDECITRDLLTPFYEMNFPGIPVGRWVSEVDDPNVQQMIENAETLVGMGAAVPQGPLFEAAGLPEAKDDDVILSSVQPQQPAGMSGIPEGVPMVTQ